ncbi:Short-chain dehydrogenase reductase sdr protein [Lasiodiplodia theobromae]|uniref:Short-chain dehydrogenase reductase sdr protein n=1 Tax=Lasiodiplodia theobromae TaxID=45133 RepID=UPI0015C3B48F|nr:Short-chain dehydrogenase reductase sdr protein [Lasiodiplodia theobromae]KAF4538131.1 Short-chain dehydrogenase reductase sdr protein [Lasiodiplodia theobromae]
MSARRSARISKIPRISYHEAQADTSDLAGDAEEDEDYYVDSSSLSQMTKKRKRTAPVSTQKKQKNTKADIFRWTDLPGEIKNTIYEFALIEQNPLYIEAAKGPKRLRHCVRCIRTWSRSPYRRRQLPEPLALGLLLVDRKTHAEAAPIFYSESRFYFDSWRAMLFFLYTLETHTKSWIRSIEVQKLTYFVGEWAFPAFDALIGVTNLQRLDIASAYGDVKVLYMHCYHWIDAVGKRRADKYAALQILQGLHNVEVTRLRELIAEDMD